MLDHDLTTDSPFETLAALAEGVRDGNPDAITTVYDARGGAAYEYCKIACGPKLADDAVVAAFHEFASHVKSASDPVDLDRALLTAVRHAAAARLEPRGPDIRRDRTLHRQRIPENPGICDSVPELLVAEVNGASEHDEAELRRHIIGCPKCRATAARLRHAERAFDAPAGAFSDPALRSAILNGQAAE
jgi:hypothetical protein